MPPGSDAGGGGAGTDGDDGVVDGVVDGAARSSCEQAGAAAGGVDPWPWEVLLASSGAASAGSPVGHPGGSGSSG